MQELFLKGRLAVYDGLGHCEHDCLAHRPHIGRCVLTQLLQVVVKDLLWKHKHPLSTPLNILGLAIRHLKR